MQPNVVDTMPFWKYQQHVKDLLEIFEEKRKAEEEAASKQKAESKKYRTPNLSSMSSSLTSKFPKPPKKFK